MFQPTNSMEPCHLFLFGDQTVSFETSLRQLLHVKGNGPLSVFFERIAFVLREEIAKLSAHQQDWFPRFTTIVDLVHDVGTTQGTPALKFPLLCLYEIGQFIKYVSYPVKHFHKLTISRRYLGEESRPYPAADNSCLVGLCTGSFAGAAISTSRTVSELIPAGVEAVLVAFRTALHSLKTRNEIEELISEANPSWSAVVSLKETQALDLIKTFTQENASAQTRSDF
jgi:naphtho-gamma-pyrone polyketide synthase